jgi:hypothetical protein
MGYVHVAILRDAANRPLLRMRWDHRLTLKNSRSNIAASLSPTAE